MRTCPHCHTPFPPEESVCPKCGIPYWEPGQVPKPDLPSEADAEERGEGCASVLMIPLLAALSVTAALILAGFVLHTLAHFESQQFKFSWIAGSCGAGFLIYRIFRKRKAKSKNGDFPQNQGGSVS